MGAFDGPEVCDLIGLFSLHKIKQRLPTEVVGLYRDNGLGLSRRAGQGGYIIERDRHRIFNDLGLKLTVEVNLKRVDFLDGMLDLNTGSTSSYTAISTITWWLWWLRLRLLWQINPMTKPSLTFTHLNP